MDESREFRQEGLLLGVCRDGIVELLGIFRLAVFLKQFQNLATEFHCFGIGKFSDVGQSDFVDVVVGGKAHNRLKI